MLLSTPYSRLVDRQPTSDALGPTGKVIRPDVPGGVQVGVQLEATLATTKFRLGVEPNRITREILMRHDNPDIAAKEHAAVDYGCDLDNILVGQVWRIGIVQLSVCGVDRWYQCVLNWCFERDPVHAKHQRK